MFIKNLFRRKVRTLLTVLGVAVGVAAIIGLGALADGMQAGYGSMLRGAKADLVLSQPDAFDISYSNLDEALQAELAAAPEVSEVSGMIQGFTATEGEPFFFVFGYPQGSFVLKRFNVIEGVNLESRQAQHANGTPILLGSAAAEVMDKTVGDTMRITGTVYRVVGIYQTGDAFEDSGALLALKDAQELLGRPRQVSLFYVRLKKASGDLSGTEIRQRFLARLERQWPDISVSGTEEFSDQQSMAQMLNGFVWAIGGLAILIGGVGMMNAQLMSVMERTREIGVLRAVGWSSRRVLWMILMESISVCLIGGLLGAGLAYLLIDWVSSASIIVGLSPANIHAELLQQAFFVVLVLGLIGGLYPAWRAARLPPIEALRYEGGSGGAKIRRLPFGGLAVQSLWQRSSRTFLTLGVIGLTVGAILAIDATVKGMSSQMTDMFTSANAQVILRQSDVADTSLSTIDERIGDKLAALPGVSSVSGLMITAVMLPETGGFLLIQGYDPVSPAIQRFNIVEGSPLTTNHQVLVGRSIADAMNKHAGDTIDLSGTRFRIAGIYESKVGWEEMGAILTLRDAQIFMGKPRKVTMYTLSLKDPNQAPALVEQINRQYPEVHAALAGEFVSQMPDMQNSTAMTDSISILAILVGGIGVLNAMLMSVFERTREIGVLRALGWRRRQVLGMILREALLLGLLGCLAGILLAYSLVYLLMSVPSVGDLLAPTWTPEIFIRALMTSLLLGLLGGLYPAFRATRLQPVEALRYE